MKYISARILSREMRELIALMRVRICKGQTAERPHVLNELPGPMPIAGLATQHAPCRLAQLQAQVRRASGSAP
eukprot:6182157-Pleurochrysis_carterae.AAC.1